MLDEKTISLICEWAKSGNEWRLDTLAPELTQAFLNELTEECDSGFRLNSVALTIAQLAEDLEKEIVLRDQWQNNHDNLTVDYDKALRENAALKAALAQACDTAESGCAFCVSESHEIARALETMLKNRAELLG